MKDRQYRSDRAALSAATVAAERARRIQVAEKLGFDPAAQLPSAVGYLPLGRLVNRARNRNRSRQTHPGKRGKS